MIKVEVKIESDQAKVSINKLVNSILSDIDIEKKLSLWELCEQLDVETFSLLKKNVYFADFLRSFSLSLIEEENSKDIILKEISEDYNTDSKNIDTTINHPRQDKCVEDSSLIIRDNFVLGGTELLDDVELPDRFLKLIKRLKNVSLSSDSFIIGETIGDLTNISTYEVSRLPGIGLSYVKVFEELKLLSQTSYENERLEGIATIDKDIDFTSVDTSDMRLSLTGVDVYFTKALEKYARHIGTVDLNNHINEILEFNKKSLIKIPGFGTSVVDRLIEFKVLVKNEIKEILLGSVNYKEFQSTLIAPKSLNKLPLSKIEEILLEDIDNYLNKISDEDSEIIEKRWGFVEPKQTLEEIGEDFNLTRERIRQKEAKINKIFIRHLRISQSTLWALLEPNLNLDIDHKFKSIFSCFSSRIDFYEFLNLICGQENLFEYVYPELEKSVLNTYFVENGAPIHIEDIKEYLIDLNLSEVRNVKNAIRYLACQDIITIEGEFVWPRQLGKSEASACVLINHNKGLPWLDVAKLVNNNSYSRTPIYEDRLDTEGFNLPDYIFLAGKGIYKHTRFIDTENIQLDEIFIEFMEYAELNSRDVFHLNECYQFSINLQAYDYYEIRHFVKHFGEDYGFYFDGRSQTDSVSLKQEFKRLTQKDVIIEAMVRNENPLTKPEIANFLKSKSLNHAAFYLDELIDSGEVVQVDRMLYTTPSLAYRNINLNKYIDALDKLLHQYSKAVEPSIFKEELNIYFSKSYSKYFYSSIARLNAKKQGWFRKHNLYSTSEIMFKNLNSAFDNFCDVDLTIDENMNLIQTHVAIKRETAVIAFSNWRVSRLNRSDSLSMSSKSLHAD